jgi:NADH dehydrogenase
MKIVVVGGTGFVGRHIARSLLDAGHEITVLGRDPSRAASIPMLQGAKAIRGDVTDPASLRGTLDGADAVVGAVQFPGYPAEVPRSGLTFDRYDRQGTENLIAEAQRAGVRRYLYISGANSIPSAQETWYRAKGRAEEALRSTGMRVVILRPSWAYGPGDKALNTYADMARFSPVIPMIVRLDGRQMLQQRIQPVYIEDVALAVRRAFEKEEAWDQSFEIGGPDIMTMREVIDTLLEVSRKKRLVLPVPDMLAKIGVAPLKLIPRPLMTPAAIDFVTQDGLVDNSHLEKVLDVHPVPLREGLSRYIGRP